MKICAEDVLRNMFVGKTLLGVEFSERKFHNKIIGVDMRYDIPPSVDKIVDEMNANPMIRISSRELEGDFLDTTLPKFRAYPDPVLTQEIETPTEIQDENVSETLEDDVEPNSTESFQPLAGISPEVVDMIRNGIPERDIRESGIILRLDNFEEIYVSSISNIEVE